MKIYWSSFISTLLLLFLGVGIPLLVDGKMSWISFYTIMISPIFYSFSIILEEITKKGEL